MDLAHLWDLLREKDMEIERLKQEIEVLKQNAATDYTTGVKNKRACMEALQFEMDQAKKKRHPFCICFADIDGFKSINDHLGHCEGDFVLKKVSEIIKSNIRSKDELFRYGGDEFVIIFPETEAAEAEKVWQRVTNQIEHSVRQQELNWQVKLSAGFSEHRPDSLQNASSLTLLQEADLKMYKAKLK